MKTTSYILELKSSHYIIAFRLIRRYTQTVWGKKLTNIRITAQIGQL